MKSITLFLILFLSVTLSLHANGILAEVQKNGLTLIDENLESEDFKSKTAYKTYVENYQRLFEALNIKLINNGLDFSKAKSVIIYCNGSWCSQSPKRENFMVPRGSSGLVDL